MTDRNVTTEDVTIDLKRVLWDEEYRCEVKELLKGSQTMQGHCVPEPAAEFESVT